MRRTSLRILPCLSNPVECLITAETKLTEEQHAACSKFKDQAVNGAADTALCRLGPLTRVPPLCGQDKLGISSWPGFPKTRRILTCSVNDIFAASSGGNLELVDGAVETILALMLVADVHLITCVPDADERDRVEASFVAAGLLSPRGSPDIPELLPARKSLYCSTAIGKVAIVRQLGPRLHVDSDPSILTSVAPHLREVIEITKGNREGKEAAGDCSWLRVSADCMRW